MVINILWFTHLGPFLLTQIPVWMGINMNNTGWNEIINPKFNRCTHRYTWFDPTLHNECIITYLHYDYIYFFIKRAQKRHSYTFPNSISHGICTRSPLCANLWQLLAECLGPPLLVCSDFLAWISNTQCALDHLSIHIHQQYNLWSLGKDKLFYPTPCDGENYLSTLVVKLMHFIEMNPTVRFQLYCSSISQRICV